MTSATLPKAKKVGADVEVDFRQTSRASKWDPLIEDVKTLEDGEKLEIPVPSGGEPELFRNTVSNAIYNHVRKPGLFPDYRFPVKLSADLKKVYVVCEFTGEDKPQPKPKSKRRRARKN